MLDIFSLAQLLFFVVVGRDPSADRFEDNVSLLVKSLNSWIEDRASEPLVSLYKRGVAKEPGARPTMAEFIDLLSTAEAYVLSASGRDDINEEDLCRRVAHLFAGLGNYTATASTAMMNSLSGQVAIAVRMIDFQYSRGATVEVDLSVADKLPMSGFKSGSNARDTLNARLSRILKRFPNVTRHNGKRGAYQVYVRINKVL